jgi:hypothetical protein
MALYPRRKNSSNKKLPGFLLLATAPELMGAVCVKEPVKYI